MKRINELVLSLLLRSWDGNLRPSAAPDRERHTQQPSETNAS